MRAIPYVLAAAALATALPAPAQDGRTNQLVGTWASEADIGPCGGPPSQTLFGMISFHKGGTVTEIARFPPTGINGEVRSNALGTWHYDAAEHVYRAVFQFDWYLQGVYNGYQVVEREIHLDNGQAAGDVLSVRYDASGNTLFSVCGYGVSTRL